MKLTNQEIWLAYPKLMQLGKSPFPVRASLGLAKLAMKLQMPYLVIERERAKLVKKYGVMDEKAKKITVPPDAEVAGAFALELSELLMAEWSEDIQFERVSIPEKLPGKCDRCGQNMDVVCLIDPQILMPLAEHFVEVI